MYDNLGRKTRVLVGAVVLSTNVYQNNPNAANYGTLTEMQYGNGTVVRNTYDDFNRVTGVRYDDEVEPRYEYAYNANGKVAFVKNNLIQHVVESEYDLSNRPCRIKTHKVTEDADGNITSSEHVYTGEVAYDDAFARMTKFTERVGEDRTEYVTEFGYDEENRPTSLGYGEHGQSTIEYDALGRVSKTTVKAGSGTASETNYTYVEGAELETEAPEDADDERKEAAANAAGKTSTTGLVASISQTGGNFTYTYDDNGNIVSVVQDGVTTSYTYDALGQLIRVVDGQEDATWEYTYDQGGNILSKRKYALGVNDSEPLESKTFTYGNANWREQLTAVDGVAITYDQIGNPLNDGTWQYTWQNGRQLARMQSVDTDASFVYNENGLRVQKTVNGVVTKYTLHGKNVVHLSRENDELHFFYDAQNKPAVVVYNGVPYSYVKNLQGDIVAILDANGAVVVSYVYDAWGRPISKTGSMASTLGTVQPFRYRGYVYDEEVGLYYLRSRIYCDACSRFLNQDVLLSSSNGMGGHNIYGYCGNSPTNYLDSNGTESSPATIQDQETFEAFQDAFYRSTGRSYSFPAGEWTYTCTHVANVSYQNSSLLSSEGDAAITVVGGALSVVSVIAMLFPGSREMALVGQATTIGGAGVSLVGMASFFIHDDIPSSDEYQLFTITISREEICGFNEYNFEKFGQPEYRVVSHTFNFLYIEVGEHSGVIFDLDGGRRIE